MTFLTRIVANTILGLTLATLATAAFARPASAQVSAGLNEIGGLVKFNHENGSSALDVDIFYGRFVTNAVEIGAGWQMYRAGDESSGSFNGFAALHFAKPASTVAPYVLARAGKHYGEPDGNQAYIAAGPGVKLFLGQNGAINLGVIYVRDFADGTLEAGNAFASSVGVSVFFK